MESTDDYVQWAGSQFKEICAQYGGPQQYLKSTTHSMSAFAEAIRAYLPVPETVQELTAGVPAEGEAFWAHVSSLGYSSLATTKPPPSVKATSLISADMLLNGVVTAHNPLLAWFPEAVPTEKDFNICWVKGMARSCTILTHMKLAMEHGVQLELVHPRLYDSVVKLRTMSYYIGGDRKKVAFMNAYIYIFFFSMFF